ncbi:MAG: DUF2024 family protein [Chitinophagaceae bacterium]|nr:DUF2024 family protein [Chitinophagaceae bacterium]
MKVAVWDTYVTRKDNKVMHFDIIVPADVKEKEIVYNFGKDYLQSKNQEGQTLTAKECNFCHIEQANDKMIESIKLKGYYVIEMQNCN